MSKTSPLYKHAKYELDLVYDEESLKDEINKDIYDNILNTVDAFTDFNGHSGLSARHTIDLISRLLNYEAISPITSNPEEWNDIGDGLWQNKRDAKYFSKDGGKTWYDVYKGKS